MHILRHQQGILPRAIQKRGVGEEHRASVDGQQKSASSDVSARCRRMADYCSVMANIENWDWKQVRYTHWIRCALGTSRR